MLGASPVQEGSFHELQRRETTRHLACSGSGPRSSVSPEQQGPLPSLMGAAERVRQTACLLRPCELGRGLVETWQVWVPVLPKQQ